MAVMGSGEIVGYNNYEATVGIPGIFRQKFNDLVMNWMGERKDVRDGSYFLSSASGSIDTIPEMNTRRQSAS